MHILHIKYPAKPKYQEELPEQSPPSQNFRKSYRSKAHQAKILGRVSGAELANPKFYEQLPEQSSPIHKNNVVIIAKVTTYVAKATTLKKGGNVQM